MKDKDFRELMDREFAQLEWTDRQRMDTLRQMNKEEQPVMKRKLIVTIIAAMLLLTLTGTAVAAGMNIISLKEFFDRYTAEWSTHGYKLLAINESNVVTPEGYRHSSNLVDVTVDQLYLTDEALYLTVHYAPKQPNMLLFSGNLTSIVLEGKEYRYYHLWDTDQSLMQISSLSICSINGTGDPVYANYTDSIRSPETGTITEMYVFKHPEDISPVEVLGSSTIMLRFQIGNLRNHDVEWDVLFIDLPQMEVNDGDAIFTR